MRALVVAAAAAAAVPGCRCRDEPGPERPAPRPPAVVATFGAGPSPVYPKRVPLDSSVRPAQLRAVPGTAFAAVAGTEQGQPVLQLIDLDRARVVWTDRRWCDGRLVHATAEILVCVSGSGVRGVRVADGELAWSNPRQYRAASGDRVLAGDALLDAGSGQIARKQAVDSEAARNARVLCPNGDVYAWSESGTMWRLTGELEEVWSIQLGGWPVETDLCADPLLVELRSGVGGGGKLFALDRDSGDEVGGPLDVLGWWRSIGGGGIDVADERGIHRRSRALGEPRPVAPARVAGRLLAEGDGLRLVRGVGGSLLVIDGDGLRAWLAAPAGAQSAVVTPSRVLAAGRLTDRSAAEVPLLYQLPPPGRRAAWPTAPLWQQDRVVLADAELTALPDPLEGGGDTIPLAGHGAAGVAAIAVAGERLYAAANDRLPGPETGAGVAAFDLRAGAWSWHQPDGCARNARVIALAVTGSTVACATRENDPGRGAVVGLDARTGAPKWRRELRTVDDLTAGGGRFVAVVGDRAVVLDAASGEVAREIASDHGHEPRVAATAAGVVTVEPGGAIAGPGWRVGVDGYVTGLWAIDGAVVVNLFGSELYALDPATGAPTRVPGFSPAWRPPRSGDLVFDLPVAPDAFAVRGYRADGSEALRVVLPGQARVAADRAGARAPVLLVDDAGPGRVIRIDPATGEVVAVHRWPRGGFRRGAFSAVVNGEPVAGVVLGDPLAAHLFPPPP